MSIQLNLEPQDVGVILGGLSKLPLETSLDTFFKVRQQADGQIAAQQAAAQAAGQPAPADQPADAGNEDKAQA